MAKNWSVEFHTPTFHTLLQPDCEECYGYKCTCCNSDRTIVISKASRKGWLIRCQDCRNLYYVEAIKL